MTFLNVEVPQGLDVPSLGGVNLPHFQWNSKAHQAFEFPATMKIGGSEEPLWSAIIGEKMATSSVDHGSESVAAYLFKELHVAIIACHTFWYDKEGVTQGRYASCPPKVEWGGSAFSSRTHMLCVVRELNELKAETLTFLTISGMGSKYLKDAIKSFDKEVLFKASRMKDASQGKAPTGQNYYPRWYFWCQLKGGPKVNVSPAGVKKQYISPLIHGGGKQIGEKEISKLFVDEKTRTTIAEQLPLAEQWVQDRETRLIQWGASPETATASSDSGVMLPQNIHDVDEIPF